MTEHKIYQREGSGIAFCIRCPAWVDGGSMHGFHGPCPIPENSVEPCPEGLHLVLSQKKDECQS